jgi:O-antigen/teichoic acid export membrane protein
MSCSNIAFIEIIWSISVADFAGRVYLLKQVADSEMIEHENDFITKDTVSQNFIFESISRILVYVGGLVSSALLARSLDITSLWTTSDFAHLKVLMNLNQVVMVFVILGLSTAVIMKVSENVGNRDNIGKIVSLALAVVTVGFILMTIATVSLLDTLDFLFEENPIAITQLKILWFLVLIGLLPSAYLNIAKSVFSGLQRRLQIMIVDVIFNVFRIVVLLCLFITALISIESVLYTFALANILAFCIGFIVLRRAFKKEGIKLTIRGWKAVSNSFMKVCFIFAGLSFIAVFFNFVTPLFIQVYGSNLDMTRFSWTQSTVFTIRSFLYAPFAVLLPNLAAYNAAGEKEKVRTRFAASNRVIVPSFLFAFAFLLVFGDAILGTIYGARALDTTGGYSSLQYLQIMSANLLVIPLSGIYSNFLTAVGRLKILLVTGSGAVILQTLWIIILEPIFGVMIIALSWVVYIPVFLTYHIYCKRKYGLYISEHLLLKSLLVTLLFIPVAYLFSLIATFTLNILLFISVFELTTIYSLARAMFAIPLWYIFIGILVLTKTMNLSDLDNLKKVLVKIPFAWWVSKPIFVYFKKYAKNNPDIMFQGELS